MPISVRVTDQDNAQHNAQLNKLPDTCPICRKGGRPDFVFAVARLTNYQDVAHVAFRCPIDSCRGMYIARYKFDSMPPASLQLSLTSTHLPVFTEVKVFPKDIESISPNFCVIYNQSQTAEQNALLQICGPGYRKAVEFLIKDFLIAHKYKDQPDKHSEIRDTFLGAVIDNHLDHPKLKQCAKRAVWLGNDQTHYIRKWDTKDINDVKALIDITVNYIAMEVESDTYLREMPAEATKRTPTPPSPSTRT